MTKEEIKLANDYAEDFILPKLGSVITEEDRLALTLFLDYARLLAYAKHEE